MQFDDISAVVCHTQLVVISTTKSTCILGTTEYEQCQHSLSVCPACYQTPYILYFGGSLLENSIQP